MDIQQIAPQEKEIARLNSIIDALITENRLLKNKIANDEKSDTSHNVPLAHDKNIIGNLNIPLAHDKNIIGNLNIPFANDKTQVGNLNATLANDKTESGNLHPSLANENIYYGNQHDSLAQVNSEAGNNRHQAAMAKTVTPNETHFHILSKYLATHAMKKSGREARVHAAKLLLHFYNHSEGNYTTLMKVSGLSYYGLGKLMGRLKKRGWLLRTGQQKFTLTDVGRKMVEGGCGGKS